MILGTGADLVRIDRMTRVIARHGARFVNRILSPEEQEAGPSPDGAGTLERFCAKRFAAKEACFKALGVGRGFGFSWHEAAVISGAGGQPLMRCTGRVHAYLVRLCPEYRIHLSLSDDPPFALAFVVIEGQRSF
jgi:holo-[acyl-carrier protein] synthase